MALEPFTIKNPCDRTFVMAALDCIIFLADLSGTAYINLNSEFESNWGLETWEENLETFTGIAAMILTKITHAIVAATALSIPVAILQPSERTTLQESVLYQAKMHLVAMQGVQLGRSPSS